MAARGARARTGPYRALAASPGGVTGAGVRRLPDSGQGALRAQRLVVGETGRECREALPALLWPGGERGGVQADAAAAAGLLRGDPVDAAALAGWSREGARHAVVVWGPRDGGSGIQATAASET